MNQDPDLFSGEDRFQPVRLLEVEIAGPLPPVPSFDPATGKSYHRALVLVRLHSRPVGLVQLALGDAGLSAEDYARSIWSALRLEILAHMREDGAPEPTALDATGLPEVNSPPCLLARETVLSNAPFVSVVVPTHDRPQRVEKCVDSLLSLIYPRYEVIVVDNAPSTPATEDLLRRMQRGDRRLRYVREKRPGASWARNRGLCEARGEIVAFTDDDVTVDRYWLAELVKGFGVAENVGCVTGLLLPKELDTPAQVWFHENRGYVRGFAQRVYDTAKNRLDNPLYPYSVMAFGSGANMAFRTSIFRSLGGFDPVLDPVSPSCGGEELAAFFDVIMRGHRVVYEPGAIARHPDYADFEGLRRQMHGWGVGFGSYVIRSLLTHPRMIPDFISRLPRFVPDYVNDLLLRDREQGTGVASSRSTEIGVELRRIERLGYLEAPLAYVRSLRRVRRLRRQYGPHTTGDPSDTLLVDGRSRA